MTRYCQYMWWLRKATAREGQVKYTGSDFRARQESRIFRKLLLLFVTIVSLLVQPQSSKSSEAAEKRDKPLFYHDLEYGSESQFNPLSNFINYGLDTLQVRQSFDDSQFGDQLRRTVDDLINPIRAINNSGGLGRFVNRQILPVDFNHLDESIEMIPNYALHLLGGGMVYRKNVEWLQAHGYSYPRLLAVLQGMSAEFLQEVIEKKSTKQDDAVADFYLFRPAGMFLFSWDPFARFAAEELRLVEWPYQPLFSAAKGRFVNVGETFIL